MTESGVYPTIWNEGDEAFDYLAAYFVSLQNIYAEATQMARQLLLF